MKAIGTISTSNVNHPTAECKQLTYTIKDIGEFEDAEPLGKELDKVSEQTGIIEVTVSNLGTDEEETNMKYKLKECGSEKMYHDIKKKLDLFLKKKGGQTTLDEA